MNGPVQIFTLQMIPMLLQTEVHRIPACHDIKGDHAAQRVGDDGHFAASALKLRVSWAEERVEAVELLRQTFSDLEGWT